MTCPSQCNHPDDRTLCASSSASSISPHWHNLDLLLNILEVFRSSFQLHAIDSLSGLAGVLEANSEI